MSMWPKHLHPLQHPNILRTSIADKIIDCELLVVGACFGNNIVPEWTTDALELADRHRIGFCTRAILDPLEGSEIASRHDTCLELGEVEDVTRGRHALRQAAKVDGCRCDA